MSSKTSNAAPGVLVPAGERVAFERSVTSLRAIELVEWVPIAPEAERKISISIAPIAIRPRSCLMLSSRA